MKQFKYLDFDVWIEREGDRYQIRVNSPGGQVRTTFDRPFSERETEDFLQLVGYSWKSVDEVEEEAKKFGGHLFERVFDRSVYARLSNSLSEAEKDSKGLRIRLHLKDVPELADMPWEYLYDKDSEKFLFVSSKTSLVRYLDIPQGIRPFPIKPPVRFLVMISNPGDSNYSSLDVEKEWNQLNKSLESLRNKVELVRVGATASALQDQLQLGTFHIFHFIGHGGFDATVQDGFLVMSDNQAPTLSGEGLGMLLQDHDTMRLVVLNSCQGARGSRSNPFSGVAQTLVKYGIPAVISMQFEITDEAAIKFSEAFYKAMANYYPVDAALGEARKALRMSKKRIEWGTPALYMRPPDGAIFEERGQLREPVVEPVDPDYDPNAIEYRKIIKAITNGRLIPFLGARANLSGSAEGLPENPFPPSDDELAAKLFRAYHPLRGEVKGLVRISQFFALRDTQELTTELHAALTRYWSVPSLHRLLATLPGILREKGCRFPYQLIVTTNYDDALEEAFKTNKPTAEPFDLICYETEGGHGGRFRYKPWGGSITPIKKGDKALNSLLEKRTVILKIHGEVDRSNPERRSYAITEDDYIHYLSGRSINDILPPLLLTKLRKSQFLFLGYRLLDWNLRVFCRRVLGDDKLPANSWVVQSEADPLDEEFWKSRDLEVLGMEILKATQEEFVNKLQARLQALPNLGGV